MSENVYREIRERIFAILDDYEWAGRNSISRTHIMRKIDNALDDYIIHRSKIQ